MPLQAIADIEARGRVPLLVGGTMLYLRALIGGIADAAAGQRADPRGNRCGGRRASAGPRCTRGSPRWIAAAAARIHPNDAQRIQRALEVHAVTGEPISALQAATRSPLEREFRRAPRSIPRIARDCTPRWRSASRT